MPLVGKGREGWFLLLFVLQFCVYTGILAYYEHGVNGKDALSTFVSVLGGMPGVIALSTASSIVFLEGLAMLSERYLKRRYEEGKEVGLKEGREEGREEGKAEGRAEGQAEGEARMSKVWEDWFKRRVEAERAGREFNEPPPSSRNGK